GGEESSARCFSAMLLRLADRACSLDDQTTVVNIDLERLTIDARQVHRDQVTRLSFIDVCGRGPVSPLKLIAWSIVGASLSCVFKQTIHAVLKDHQILQRIPLL